MVIALKTEKKHIIFNKKNSPPQIKELERFDKDLIDLKSQ